MRIFPSFIKAFELNLMITDEILLPREQKVHPKYQAGSSQYRYNSFDYRYIHFEAFKKV